MRTHGTLEWLPGKAVALDEACAPEAVLGPLPVLYPFIVNNPGEAAQARRRLSAVAIGHLTPPLAMAGTHGVTSELEALFDEYADAQMLDARRAKLLAEAILDKARESGLLEEIGLRPGVDADTALQELDAWLCDLKEMRIGDGLHVFGEAGDAARRTATLAAMAEAAGTPSDAVAERYDACPGSEIDALLRGLGGRFVQPGPAGAPLPRPARRPADRPQPLQHRPARHPHADGLGDRPADRRGGRQPLRPGPRRLAAQHRRRPLGQRHYAHRRRRPRAGHGAARRQARLGHRLRPRLGLRDPAPRRHRPAAD